MKKLLTPSESPVSKPPPPPPPSDPFMKFPGRVWRYEEPDANQLKLGLWVSSVGLHANQPAHTLIQNRRSKCYQGIYVSKGRGYFENAHLRRQEIAAGTFIWIVPGVPYSYSPQPQWDIHWISFGGTLADEFHSQKYISEKRPLIPVGNNVDVRTIMTQIDEVFLKARPLSMSLAASLVYQLIVVVHGLSSGAGLRGAPLDPAVCEALRILEHEATSGIQPDHVARRLHEGYSTLRRRFKRQTGHSMKEYIVRLKLRRGRELLALTAKPIAEVARESGFENPLYFSRAFHTREGLSPTEFRRRRRGGIEA